MRYVGFRLPLYVCVGSVVWTSGAGDFVPVFSTVSQGKSRLKENDVEVRKGKDFKTDLRLCLTRKKDSPDRVQS